MPSQAWDKSMANNTSIWRGGLLFCTLVALGIAIAALILALILNGRVDELVTTTSELTTTTILLQQQIDNFSSGLNSSEVFALFPSAGVQIATAAIDGNALLYHATEEFSTVFWYVKFATELWDDANYWNPLAPAYLSVTQTGRYGITVSCPNVAAIQGFDVSGQIDVAFFDNSQPADCSIILATQVINGPVPAAGPAGPFGRYGYAANIYTEVDLLGTASSSVGLALSLVYDPYQDPTSLPKHGGADICSFFIRYLGPATNPIAPNSFCVKKRNETKIKK